jgi:hypothetical protein
MIQHLLATCLLLSLVALSATRAVPSPSLAELKANPLKYDGKVIHFKGWLTSGHSGVFCYDEARQHSVRIRAVEEIPRGASKLVRRDDMYAEFWRRADQEIPKDAHPGVHVELHALVRVLKVNGKPAKEFSVLSQFPIELVPIRVLALQSRQ